MGEEDDDPLDSDDPLAHMDMDVDSVQDLAKCLKQREGEDDTAFEKRRGKVIASGNAYIKRKGSAKSKIRKTCAKDAEPAPG